MYPYCVLFLDNQPVYYPMFPPNTGEQPHMYSDPTRPECPQCHKTFSRRSNLIRHLKLHTGIKPFECLECHKKFTSRTNLKIHKSTHETPPKLYCEYCGKEYNRPRFLAKHAKHHEQMGHPKKDAFVQKARVGMKKFQKQRKEKLRLIEQQRKLGRIKTQESQNPTKGSKSERASDQSTNSDQSNHSDQPHSDHSSHSEPDHSNHPSHSNHPDHPDQPDKCTRLTSAPERKNQDALDKFTNDEPKAKSLISNDTAIKKGESENSKTTRKTTSNATEINDLVEKEVKAPPRSTPKFKHHEVKVTSSKLQNPVCPPQTLPKQEIDGQYLLGNNPIGYPHPMMFHVPKVEGVNPYAYYSANSNRNFNSDVVSFDDKVFASCLTMETSKALLLSQMTQQMYLNEYYRSIMCENSDAMCDYSDAMCENSDAMGSSDLE